MRNKQNYNSYMNAYMKARYQRRRLAAIQKLGSKCVACGITEDLQFHHKDRSTKEMSVARAASLSNARWDAEVEKCELLCGACHREHHHTE